MGKEIRRYKEILIDLFDQIEAGEEKIREAAALMADAIQQDRLIYVVGTGGHSNMAAEEMLWRAGGLVPVNAMLDAGTNLIHGAKRSNIVERTPGYGQTLFNMYGLRQGDLLIIANAYGINSMSIDMAQEARRRGIKTIGVTSTSFCKLVPKNSPSRHPSGENLYEIVDVFVNCCLPEGDCMAEIDGMDQKVAPTSTFCNAFAINCLVIETCRTLKERGVNPPVWMSANHPDGDKWNKSFEEKYFSRVKHLM